MNNVLTKQKIDTAMNFILENSRTQNNGLIFIENANFYGGKFAKSIGYDCSEEEIEKAHKNKDRFIKTVGGVKLFISGFTNPL